MVKIFRGMMLTVVVLSIGLIFTGSRKDKDHRRRLIKGEYISIKEKDTFRYVLQTPETKGRKKYPLVVFLHGSGERGNDNEAPYKSMPVAFNSQTFACYVLVPQCPKNDVWVNFPAFPTSLAATDSPTRAAAQTLKTLERVMQEFPVDRQRIYLTGYSMGGEGTFDLLWRRPDLFAAAVPVCAVADTAKASLIKDIPLWAFHGDQDAVNDVKYTRMMIEALKKKGGAPKYIEYAGVGHRCWPQAYADTEFLSWLFSQRKGR